MVTTDEKRGITYQISKNKGLTPRRKKELRNPRVKNRMKYRKAKIRRKGQVCLIYFLFIMIVSFFCCVLIHLNDFYLFSDS